MYQDSKRTCTAIVLLIKPFVWRRAPRRSRRGLLKLPNDWWGGGAEREARINAIPPPPPRFGPSVKAYFLVHFRSLQLCTIPLVLSLIQSVCVDFDEIENLFGISFTENLPNNCFRFSFSPTKSLATSTGVRASFLSL